MSLSRLSVEKQMVSSGRDVGEVCPLPCGGYPTAAMEASTVQRPRGPRRRSVENQSPQGKGHPPPTPDGGETGRVSILLQFLLRQRRGKVSFSGLFSLRRETALGPSWSPKPQLTRESLFCAEAQMAPAHRTWSRLAVVPGMQLGPGQQLLRLAPSKRRAVQRSRVLMASGMSSGKPRSPRTDARSNSPLLLP